MAQQKFTIDYFYGGMSDTESVHTSIENAASMVRNLNIHEDPNYITFNPMTIKDSGGVVTDLVKWMVDCNPWSTDRYAYGDSGNVYKISGSTWTLDHVVPGSAGQGMWVFQDYLYCAASTTISRKGKLSLSGGWTDDFLSDGTLNLDQSQASAGQTYTLTTTITETGVNTLSFTPTRDPIKEIDVLLNAPGTGNWTLTVHDAKNVSLGSATVTNGNLASIGSYQPFVFSTPLRVTLGNTYHFHLTSTTGDGSVTTSAAGDLSKVAYKEYLGILVADGNFHMMADLNGLIIANERYLATWDEVVYNPNKIVFDSGFKGRVLTKVDEFVVAECWRGAATDTTTDGRAYWWDGIQTVFNYSKPITAGLPNAAINFKNRLLSFLGPNADVYLGGSPFQFIQRIPNTNSTTRGNKYEIFPGAITVWGGRVVVGLFASTTDGAFNMGAYELGNFSDRYPEVMTLAYTISTGNYQNIAIGCCAAFGKDLYISWKDTNSGTVFGVDKVNKTNNPFTSGSWEGLIFDDESTPKTKLALRIHATMTPLQSGESVTPKYKLDRAASFTLGTTDSTANDTYTETIVNTRHREITIGFDLATATTYPKVTSLELTYNDLKEEEREK